MKAVVQRVQRASVTYGDRTESIGEGLLVLLGVARGDGLEEADWMAHRIARLRVFPDESQKMSRAVIDHGLMSWWSVSSRCWRIPQPGIGLRFLPPPHLKLPSRSMSMWSISCRRPMGSVA